MKFIKLTEVRQTENIEFFVRPSNIVCIQKSSSAFANAIVDIDGSISKWVKETPEEIMEMIKEEKCQKTN